MEYSYEFSDELQQQWRWSERYASQPEILAYLDHVADRFDLRRDIQFDTRVKGAIFNEATDSWVVRTDDGHEMSARFLVLATGVSRQPTPRPSPASAVLRVPPSIPAVGRTCPSISLGSEWASSVPVPRVSSRFRSLPGRPVSLLFSSAPPPIRCRRTTDALDEEEQRAIKADYSGFRERNRQMPFALGSRLPLNEILAMATEPEERARVYEDRWQHGGLPFLGAFGDLLFDDQANDTAAEFG